MSKYKFGDFAINCTEKKIPSPEDYSTYIGLEHMDTKCLKISRWGSDVPIIGEKLIMHKGDILLGKRNAYLRRAAIAPHDGIFSAHGMILRPKEEIVDYDFFALFIASDYFFDEAIRISVGSLSPTINWKDLKELEFYLPDLETQRKLAKTLWSINDTLDSYKEMLKQSDELVKAKFIEMFGTPIDNEKNWKTIKVSDICDILNGYAFKSSDYVEKSEIYNCRMSNIRPNGEFDINYNAKFLPEAFWDKYSQYQLKNGDIIIAMTDMAGDPKILGVPTEIKTQGKKMLLNQRVGKLIFNDSTKFNKLFIRYYLSHYKIRQELVKGATKSIQVNVGKETILNLPIFVAPIELQNNFICFAQRIDKSKLNIQECITKLETLYKKIINKYLTKEEN